jgi:hypothetical protein
MQIEVFRKAANSVLRYTASAKTAAGRDACEGVTLTTHGYAEPGYDDSESGVIALGNLNAITRRNDEKQRSDVEIHVHGSIPVKDLGSCRRVNSEGMAIANDRNPHAVHVHLLRLMTRFVGRLRSHLRIAS